MFSDLHNSFKWLQNGLSCHITCIYLFVFLIFLFHTNRIPMTQNTGVELSLQSPKWVASQNILSTLLANNYKTMTQLISSPLQLFTLRSWNIWKRMGFNETKGCILHAVRMSNPDPLVADVKLPSPPCSKLRKHRRWSLRDIVKWSQK